jgi:hypothetical protein
VRDANNEQIGVLRRPSRWRPPPETNVRLLAGAVGREVEVGTLAPRIGYSRANARGLSQIIDGSGEVAAQVTDAGDFRFVVLVSPHVDDELRALVVAFACSLVEHEWLYWRRPSDAGN